MKYRFMESNLKINGEYYIELNCLELLELFTIVYQFWAIIVTGNF